MKNWNLGVWVVVLFAGIILGGCNSNSSVIVSGQVIEVNSGSPLNSVIVQITDPARLDDKIISTDSTGNFSFALDVNKTLTITLEASRPGYQSVTKSFKVAEGNDVDDLNIRLIKESNGGNGNTGNGGSDNNDDEIGGDAGPPSSLELVNISSSSIAVRGTGGDEDSKFTFAVKDSAGRKVDQGYQVSFSIIRGPGGGARIDPAVGVTNAEGTVSSSIASGDSSGVIKMQATIRETGGGMITSNPVLLAVGNGFPEKDNFHIAPLNRNFEGFGLIYSKDDKGENPVQPNYILASLGDYRNNPVLPGTAVDFTTTAGNITASAVTDENGTAVAELRPDGSKPSGNSRGVGFATVTARTVDINDQYITQKTNVLFSSRNPRVSLDPATFHIPSGGGKAFTLTIKDVNGNPVAGGTAITVITSQGLTNTFGTLVLGDYITPGVGHTEFDFTVSDADDDNNNTVSTSITVNVQLPSGVTKSVSFKGTRAKIK